MDPHNILSKKLATEKTHGPNSIDEIVYECNEEDRLKERAYSGLVEAGIIDDSLPSVEEAVTILTGKGERLAVSRYIYFGDVAYFSRIWVAKPLRGNGVGTRLTRHTLDLLRKRNVSEVYVIAKSEEAVSIFNKLGFSPSEKIDGRLVKHL